MPASSSNGSDNSGSTSGEVERFAYERDFIVRHVLKRDGKLSASRIKRLGRKSGDPGADFDWAWLRSKIPPPQPSLSGTVNVADLFSGCGAMSLGMAEACRALGVTFVPRIAIDNDEVRSAAYRSNFAGAQTVSQPIEQLFDGRVGARRSVAERKVAAQASTIDVLVGGPPCQGHSDLNNRTRRRDPRNALFHKMVRAAEILNPRHVVIENVPGVKHDRDFVLERAADDLARFGYSVQIVTIRAEEIGVAQLRRRTFLVASERSDAFESREFQRTSRSFSWACGGLVEGQSNFDRPAKLTSRNRARIDHLFSNDLFDLPDSERPPCHRDKPHSYVSMYGRLRWDEPAQTITTGFRCMGQGRFVHPLERRTLTAHEAARLQFIPDFFSFGNAGPTALAEMIGNAVPPKLTYALALHLLR